MKNTILLNIALILILFLFNPAETGASPLSSRLENFPHWDSKPLLNQAKGDLVYPEWLAGNWQVTSILVAQYAPLAPHIVTPGFTDNEAYLDVPVLFPVKFVPQSSAAREIIADREFNGLAIATAYLGKDKVKSVKVDPSNPNRQITWLSNKRQLITTVTGRGKDNSTPAKFIASELSQQIFRSDKSIYLNEVETTTEYQRKNPDLITAEQITAIYLSPQDPAYFQAQEQPVALY
ncbi:MAG: hypothetical protein D6756_06400, partial [Cyanobacteria bacterium J083]